MSWAAGGAAVPVAPTPMRQPSSNSHTLQLRIDVFDAAALHGAGPEGRARAERTAACCGGAVERSIGFPGVHTPVSGSSGGRRGCRGSTR